MEKFCKNIHICKHTYIYVYIHIPMNIAENKGFVKTKQQKNFNSLV